MSLTQVWLSLGSNTQQSYNLAKAVSLLAEFIKDMRSSRVFETEPVNFKSANFYNFVLTGYTDLSVLALNAQLKQIENQQGRDRKIKEIPLDIDLLMYGDVVGCFDDLLLPRQGILDNAYVLLPLALVSPTHKHPTAQKTFAKLWNEAKIEQKLWPIEAPWLSLAQDG